MPNYLRKLAITSIGLVDKGAGKGVRVCLVKRDNVVAKENSGMPPEIEAILAALSPEAKTALMAYIESCAKAAPEEPKKEDPMAPGVAKKFAEVASERDTLAKKLEALEDQLETREFIEKARGLEYIPGLSTEELAKTLRTVKKNDPASFPKFEAALKSASEAIKKGDLLRTVGKAGGAQSDANTASAKVELMAKAMVEKDPSLSIAKARDQVWKRNPDLYTQYKTELQGGN
jgi:hypothetical protein